MSRRGENIYHRKDGLWEARYLKEIDIYGKKKYGSVYARTYKEAKAKRQNAMHEIYLYQKPKFDKSITISQLVEEWLYLNKNRLKSSTYQRYCGYMKNHIKDVIGKVQVIYFTTFSVHEFALNREKTGLSRQSINSVLIFLHSCLKYGHRQYNLPLPEFKYFSCYPKEMRVLSLTEQNKLVEYLKKDMDIYKFGVLFALYTGLRIGELCALQWEDIDNNYITVKHTILRLQKEDGTGTELVMGTPKTRNSQRIIPIPSILNEFLEYFRVQQQGQKYLLGMDFKPIAEPRTMQNKFKKYIKAVGIEGATFHTLRHTFATRCVEVGFEVKSLSEILGHSNIQLTLSRYVHSSMQLKQENMEKLSVFK